MTNDNIVVGMGEALWDVLPEGKKIGGAPANFAYHVSQFGLPSCVVSAVGADALGREIVENFTSKGLTHLLPEVPYPTGTVQVEIDQAGIPQYDIRENVAWDNIPFTPQLEELARRTRAVCFGSLAQRNVVSRNTIGSFLDAMPRLDDSLVVFDVNLRQGFYNKEILCDSKYLDSICLTRNIIEQNPNHNFLLVDYVSSGESLRNAHKFLSRPDLLGNPDRIKMIPAQFLFGLNSRAVNLDFLFMLNDFKKYSPVNSLSLTELDKTFERLTPDPACKDIRNIFLFNMMSLIEKYINKTAGI